MSTFIGAIFEEVKEEDKSDGINFDEFKNKSESDWTIPEAYMCLLLRSIYADGVAKQVEADYVRGLVSRCRTFRNESQDSLAALNIRVKKRMEEAMDPVAEACEALPPDMHLCLFAHAVDIVLSDGELADAEQKYLDELIAKMKISDDQAKQIMRVIFAKNRW
ncbi:MAG: TerB family tellurite resistance protein [Pseudomonadota bacterium]